ncbi:MAG TPA: GspH/FimT family pseudopilin [Thermoanaerobaculia bacterium]|nr:GspH/FimT family pseudopilin [Thermoanaerobaculia bacterium]
MRQDSRKAQRGYTLVEALIVMAIIGLISLVAVPSFITLYQSSKMRTSVRIFSSDLRWARQRAVSRNIRTLITFDTGAGKSVYRFYDGIRQADGTYNWTPTLASPTRAKERSLDPVVYFLSTGFADDVVLPAPDASLPDIVYSENGSVQNIPALAADQNIMLKTDLPIPKNQFEIDLAPAGQVRAK